MGFSCITPWAVCVSTTSTNFPLKLAAIIAKNKQYFYVLHKLLESTDYTTLALESFQWQLYKQSETIPKPGGFSIKPESAVQL